MSGSDRSQYWKDRRDVKRGGPARNAKDCATDGPSVATARRHQRKSKRQGLPPSRLLKECENGCYEVWQKHQAKMYQNRKNRG